MKKRSKWKTVNLVLDRIFGFFFVTAVIVGIAALGFGYIATRDTYPSLREKFVMTMDESRRFRFVSRIFLSQTEYDELLDKRLTKYEEVMDPSLIHIAAQEPQTTEEQTDAEAPSGADSYGIVDEDGDGYVLMPVSGRGYNGYMLIVLDPSRCFVANGGGGQTIDMIAERNGAIGGINGGAFFDPSGGGSGGQPEGLTIYDGVVRHNPGYACSIAGFNSDHVLFVGWFTYEDCVANDIVSCVSFSPPLIINGVPNENLVSSVNPRTSIGQRADGAVLMLVIDGRQASGMGATYADMRDVMLQYGAVNACNLDGGSSSVMYYQGEIINMPSSASGASRWLPNAFLFK